MTSKRERTRNTNDTATLSGAIALNNTTSATIAPANTNRMFFHFSNPGNKDVWLKLQAASVDNDKKGIWVPKGKSWEMSPDEKYPGEISAITNVGTTSVYYTEY